MARDVSTKIGPLGDVLRMLCAGWVRLGFLKTVFSGVGESIWPLLLHASRKINPILIQLDTGVNVAHVVNLKLAFAE